MALTFYEYITSKSLWRAVLAEFLGTALFVFLSSGTMLLTSKYGQLPPTDSINIFVTAFTTGFALATLDFILEPTSGANFNPAFTFGLFCIGKTTLMRCIFYTAAQIAGGMFGSGALYFVCPIDHRRQLGATILWNNVKPLNGFYVEAISTCLALFFILCSDELPERKTVVTNQSAIRVGVAFTVLTLSGFPYTTVSMNPARSFGPAFLSGTWPNHWIYWVGPYVGATVAALCFGYMWARKPQHEIFYRHTSGVVRPPVRSRAPSIWANDMEKSNRAVLVENTK